jgi:6-phosphogluconolactonase (cycloisomerase 2 family)
MSNAIAANQILGFRRAADGKLTPMSAPFATGGKGTGAGLGEQGAVAFDRAKNLVYTVNAGDNSFSILPVKDDGTLAAATHVAAPDADAGGARLLGPKSITFHDNVVYVLFQGDATTPSMIAGWTVSSTGGSAAPIAASALPLSSATQSVDPAQIEFSPDGKWLVVTEKQSGAAGAVKGDGSIDSFAVGAGGVATKMGFYPTASAGADAGFQMTPFGFEFLGTHLIVSEAGSTGVGSYTYAGGIIAPVASSQFASTDPAPCWVAVSSQWAYVTNARGPSISGFAVDATSGALANIAPVANGVVASTGRTLPSDAGLVFQGPTDEFVSYDGQFLYVLNAAVPSIGIFRIKSDGSLARVGDGDYTSTPETLPAGAVGIVAR